jgi:hypothetical protein
VKLFGFLNLSICVHDLLGGNMTIISGSGYCVLDLLEGNMTTVSSS